MKNNIISLLIFILSVNLYAGVGGYTGGESSWAPEELRGATIDWPLVRYNKSRSYELHELCINDEDSLETLKKYKVKERVSLFRTRVIGEKPRKLERVYSERTCVYAGDPKCNLANKYVEKNVVLPIYRGKPRATRGGLEMKIDFILRAQVLKNKSFTIPNCK